jgi:acetyl esterase/lipase
MTTLRYKLFEKLLGWSGAGRSITKAVAGEKIRHDMPKGDRWTRGEFEGRAIWTCLSRSNATGRVYVHQHGGAYVLGLNAVQFATFAKLADMSGATIILPDYPLPPEQTAEGIIAFAKAHFASLVEEHGAENVKLGGDSAGANLALAVAQGQTELKPLLLLSPWVDLDMSDMADDVTNTEILLQPESLKRAAQIYAGGLDRKSPQISPIFADPKDYPAVEIFTGELDLLYRQIMAFADRMAAAGKIAKLATYGEFGHYWMFYPVPDRDSTLEELAARIAS